MIVSILRTEYLSSNTWMDCSGFVLEGGLWFLKAPSAADRGELAEARLGDLCPGLYTPYGLIPCGSQQQLTHPKDVLKTMGESKHCSDSLSRLTENAGLTDLGWAREWLYCGTWAEGSGCRKDLMCRLVSCQLDIQTRIIWKERNLIEKTPP